MPSYRKKGGTPSISTTTISPGIIGARSVRMSPSIEFTVHGLDVTLAELIQILEFSIDKEKFETMIITIRLLDKALENEFDLYA